MILTSNTYSTSIQQVFNKEQFFFTLIQHLYKCSNNCLFYLLNRLFTQKSVRYLHTFFLFLYFYEFRIQTFQKSFWHIRYHFSHDFRSDIFHHIPHAFIGLYVKIGQ